MGPGEHCPVSADLPGTYPLVTAVPAVMLMLACHAYRSYVGGHHAEGLPTDLLEDQTLNLTADTDLSSVEVPLQFNCTANL
jgi:hypothetical protein